MHIEMFRLKFVPVKDNFLHFAPSPYANLAISSVHGLKAENKNGQAFYFSSYSSPYVGQLEDDCVGISSSFAQSLKLVEEQCLLISTINNVGSIRRLYVSPWTEDDLEIACSATAVIESHLLSQLRIVWPQQIFCTWISENVAIRLCADALSPNLQFGRLEEYTEIEITMEPKRKTPIQPSPSHPTYLRSESASSAKKSTCSIHYRCVPIDGDLSRSIRPDKSPPFTVFAIKSKHIQPATDTCNLWKLSKIDCDQAQADVHVQLTVLETVEHLSDVRFLLKKEFQKGHRISKWPLLFVGESVKRLLKIELGSKVNLEPLLGVNLDEKISGLMISPMFDFESTLRATESLVEEVKETLKELVFHNVRVLLNSKGEIRLKSGNFVQLTLRPLDLVWSFYSNATLRNISFNCNEFNLSKSPVNSSQYYFSDNVDVGVSPWCDADKLLNKLSLTDCSNPHLTSNALITGIYNYADIIKRSEDTIKHKLNVFITILTGKSGCGKSYIANSLLKAISRAPYFFHVGTVDCMTLKGKRVEVIVRDLNDCIMEAASHQPSVIFLKSIDAVASCSKDDQQGSEATLHVNRVTHKIAELLEECQRSYAISILATAISIGSIHPRMFSPRGKSLFSSHFQIPVLTKKGRRDIMEQLIIKETPSTNLNDLKLDDVVDATENFLLSDLIKLIKTSLFEAWKRKIKNRVPLRINNEDLKSGLDSIKPSYLEGVTLSKETKHNWSTVGGLKAAKEKLTEVIIWPTKYPHVMSQCPLKAQTGILLYGPPGSGKTILARAAASESNLNFITVKGPELMSKYIGQSEEGVRSIFEKAQAANPSLLFFDEFESLAPRRGKDQTGVTDRVVNQFLTALDGVEPLTGVFVMAATSRPDLIDPAILRPGRIGVFIPCHFPDKNARLEILSALSASINMDDDVDLSIIAEKTEGLSGADLKGLLSSAQLKVIDEIVEQNCGDDKELQDMMPSIMANQKDVKLKQQHILEALESTKPSLSEQEKNKFDTIYREFLKPSIVNVETQKLTLA